MIKRYYYNNSHSPLSSVTCTKMYKIVVDFVAIIKELANFLRILKTIVLFFGHNNFELKEITRINSSGL